MWNAGSPLRDIVRHARARRVLEDLHVERVFSGDRTLGQGCALAGCAVETALELLERAMARGRSGGADDGGEHPSVAALVQHIVGVHHAYAREAFEKLALLADEVARAHGARHGALGEVRALLDQLAVQQIVHFEKEERVLFPYLVALETARLRGGPLPQPPIGGLATPIRIIATEHGHADRLLEDLRIATRDYTPPDDADDDWRALYEGLRALELDMERHLALENGSLYRRGMALADEPPGSAPGAPSR